MRVCTRISGNGRSAGKSSQQHSVSDEEHQRECHGSYGGQSGHGCGIHSGKYLRRFHLLSLIRRACFEPGSQPSSGRPFYAIYSKSDLHKKSLLTARAQVADQYQMCTRLYVPVQTKAGRRAGGGDTIEGPHDEKLANGGEVKERQMTVLERSFFLSP